METTNVEAETQDSTTAEEQNTELSSQVEVPARLIDQVIGQEHAVEVIKKAAIQRRHVMMIGSPGTGQVHACEGDGRTPPEGGTPGHPRLPEF